MSLLELQGLTHSFGDSLLYKNAGFTLNRGEHIGVVGQNGAGKSTLIKICAGEIIPDEGRLVCLPQLKLGYLDQYAKLDAALTMREYLRSAFSELYQAERELSQLYEQAAHGHPEALDAAANLQEYLERGGFYTIDTRIQQVASGLGLHAIGLEQPMGAMSGGQRTKVILAKLLLEKPDILLLDEPTNFLDTEHIAWLAQYLAGLENAFLAVSHDYAFLDTISNRICDIDNLSITKYYGPYREFVKKKNALRQDYIRQYAAQQREIKKTEEFIRKNIAGIKSKMARGRQKQLDRMERLEALSQKEPRPAFEFSPLPTAETPQLTASGLAVGYHSPILSHLDFQIKGGEKIVITGFNGIGKSTLLKTLIGEIEPLEGSFQFAEQTVIGYFAQELSWGDINQTPYRCVADAFPHLTEKEIRRRLAQCSISAKQALQPIGTLSGGEQAKLKLCLACLAPCNFLLLDEPTNHLDASAKDALRDALIRFSGAVVLVCHEKEFYHGWAHRVLHIQKQ